MTTATSITVRVPLAIRHRPGRKTVVVPMADDVASVTTRADPALVKALPRAFRYQRMLDEGRYATISEMAGAERIERGYLGGLLRLTLLAPDIVSAILDGQQRGSLSLAGLAGPTVVGWDEQRAALGLAELNGPCGGWPKSGSISTGGNMLVRQPETLATRSPTEMLSGSRRIECP